MPDSGAARGRRDVGPDEHITPLPESAYAREVFSTLGGIVEIGAVVATGAWAVADASVGSLVSARRAEIDRLLAVVRALGGFSDASMAVVDELGCLREHEVTAPSLLLWSGCIEEISPRLTELERPSAVRRMCRMGADLQLAHFLQALVTASIAGGTEAARGAERVAEALTIAVALADDSGRSGAADTFRAWRVAFLPGVLRPDSSAPEYGRAGFRAYAHALEELLEQADGRGRGGGSGQGRG
ncbi:hypothetical protein ACFYW8_19370 [Streptomyces sp. NPDC002742]|uniref:hypothetical protein n=1 Tax=Streptomyces sp. NPDC002742 TaxID=3364663 RepID=UPI0036B4C1EB